MCHVRSTAAGEERVAREVGPCVCAAVFEHRLLSELALVLVDRNHSLTLSPSRSLTLSLSHSLTLT